ncbi:MAG: hypothetical protein LBJ77_01530 [Holosporales bacterium]|nr:hypothetical protein [Holosporales bacterium]
MKIFNKFANKNVGKPGLTSLHHPPKKVMPVVSKLGGGGSLGRGSKSASPTPVKEVTLTSSGILKGTSDGLHRYFMRSAAVFLGLCYIRI